MSSALVATFQEEIVLNEEQLVKDIFKLFVARRDTYAIMGRDRSYTRREGEVTPHLIKSRLTGEITIGLYTIDPKTKRIRWICFDIDQKHHDDPEAVARRVLSVLRERAPTGAVLLEASRR